ncbi:MAG: hypothetical protein Q9174_000854 [Haloplaca sp. 1 TL-2023]
MTSEAPNPQHLTLRFRQHKLTILLFVSPQDTIDSIKSKLLETIQSTGVNEINGHRLPTNAEDISLGVPIDKNDISQGWVDLEIPALDDNDGKKGKAKESILNKTPQGAGLKDGSLLAFRFQAADKDDDELIANNERWDVVMPSFEEDEAK